MKEEKQKSEERLQQLKEEYEKEYEKQRREAEHAAKVEIGQLFCISNVFLLLFSVFPLF